MKLKYTLRGMGIGLLLASLLFFFLRGSDKQVLSDDEIKKRATELGMLTPEALAEKKLDELKERISGEEKDKEQPNKTTEKTVAKEEVVNSPSNHEGEGSKEEGTASFTENKNKEVNKTTEETLPETGNRTEEGKATDKTLTTGKEQASLQGRDSAKAENTGESISKAEAEGTDTTKTKSDIAEKVRPKQPTQAQKVENSKPNAEVKTYTYQVIPGSSAVRLCKDLEALGLIKDASDFNHYLAVNNYATRIRKGTFTFYSTESYFDIAEKLVSRQINP